MAKIHPLADVHSTQIGPSTTVWQFCVVLQGAVIGDHCNINAHCLVENDVIVGDSVTVKCGVYLWDGLRVGDHVFIGPNATFTNDRYPRSKQYPDAFPQTVVEHHASIGAGAVILPGVTIGHHAMVGAGAVVTRDVPPHALVTGNPARLVRYLDPAEAPPPTSPHED
ncbi:acyltransferase [Pseudoduganella lutea]|uniref:N-acetyltransferase n=1 Tax=Pseudoduganella lutea TaxID=321985 RepID=A0A4P6KYA0_9BURK|nr:acyltransferase [Pseudoduganella lutea]QBE64020.1 N-acetyltransferase [Pseudoduganella lutea]